MSSTGAGAGEAALQLKSFPVSKALKGGMISAKVYDNNTDFGQARNRGELRNESN